LIVFFMFCREGDPSSDIRVGLMTYDSRIHLYDLSPELSRPHMLVIAETEDLQLPVREGLLVSLKDLYCAVLERPLQELREELQTDVTEALASYRKHCCSSSVSDGQLVLPQFLRALPVYVNSLRKSEVLLPGLRSSVHQRLQQRCRVLGLDTCSTVRHFYPLLLPLVSVINTSDLFLKKAEVLLYVMNKRITDI
ncbi:hypothetical protein GOODEAATRI_027262, partial [Goodea atripinnis]